MLCCLDCETVQVALIIRRTRTYCLTECDLTLTVYFVNYFRGDGLGHFNDSSQLESLTLLDKWKSFSLSLSLCLCLFFSHLVSPSSMAMSHISRLGPFVWISSSMSWRGTTSGKTNCRRRGRPISFFPESHATGHSYTYGSSGIAVQLWCFLCQFDFLDWSHMKNSLRTQIWGRNMRSLSESTRAFWPSRSSSSEVTVETFYPMMTPGLACSVHQAVITWGSA